MYRDIFAKISAEYQAPALEYSSATKVFSTRAPIVSTLRARNGEASMDKQKVEQSVAVYFAALSAGDEAGWLASFARNGALHDPADTPPCIGEESLRGFFRTAYGAFASLSIRAENVFVRGSQAAVKFRGEGVGKNGRALSFEGIDIFDINVAGRIQRVRGYWDAAAAFSQLQA